MLVVQLATRGGSTVYSDPATLARDGGFRSHRSFYFRNFEYYRRVMVRNGDGHKPLWLAEVGWSALPEV